MLDFYAKQCKITKSQHKQQKRRNKMKTFKENGVEYSIRQDMGRKGIQYKARYVSDPTVTEAWVFLPGRKHTRKQIVAAIDRVNTYNELDE